MTDKECFIIMPITTPKDFISAYKDDCEHFLHIMKCLFKPAIEKAGFKPILPVTKGSEIIHGEIISKIESSELVLCDMSILNPNVFFELGIRTALNKPICLIKDNLIEKVPFDTNIINYHVYSPDLSCWIVKNEIEKLAKHISESFTKSKNCNSLWKYFSLKSIARPPEVLSGDNENIEYLTMQVDAIRKQLNELQNLTMLEQSSLVPSNFGDNLYQRPGRMNRLSYSNTSNMDRLSKHVRELLSKYVVNPEDIILNFTRDLEGRTKLYVDYDDKIGFTKVPIEAINELNDLSWKHGIKIEIERVKNNK